jgi:plasmid stability protein
MPALNVRNVPERVVVALKERAARRGRSLQQELIAILEEAAARIPRAPRRPPLKLVTVKTKSRSSWRRDEIYGDEGR